MTRYHLWILAGLLMAGGAQAQSDQAQLVRPSGANDLGTHLARLAANPRDMTALIGAGEAALELDDPRAAAGFFARAESIDGRNGRVKAGLARVMLQMRNPAEALRLFDQATALGFPENGLLSDRGLARDMVGDQAGAQRDYQAALKNAPDDPELTRRYAASLGISGQVEASDRVLEPLLYKSDRAAWRYRAFILAMNNRQADAKKIADQTLPAPLATALTPYLQKMPYLTAAQKAAAVHLGHFPATTGTTIAAVTPTAPPPSPPAAAPPQTAAVTPSGTTDRRTGRSARRATALAQAETQRPQTAPAPVPQAAAPVQQAAAAPPPAPPSAVAAAPTPAPPAAPPRAAMVQPLPARPAPVTQAARPSAVQGPPAPGFETMESARRAPAAQLNAITLAQAAAPAAAPAAQPAAPTASTAPAPTVPASPRPQPDMEAARTLADIIRAIDVPESERRPTVAAVDLAEVAAMQAERRAERQAAAKAAADKAAADRAKAAAAAKAKAEAAAKAKKEAEEKRILAANPSRSWLQIGIGANRAALPFTLKTVRGKYADIASQQGWFASWGRTNRLLVGPFPNFARAKALEDKLKAQGADVFAWQSSAGEVVERLAGQ